ncbi:MAG: NAD(P)/FAD-dependent oxidoreductase [Halieaceae bacterium]|nr:NAD(P)/FAD-dependent oxidoreductase [Halieaceae bacterium]
MSEQLYDAIIIGAGPSGSIAGTILNGLGRRVLILEREQFPRFSIGESLLPQCMQYVEEAGMLEAVQAAGLQRKNGAMFQRRGQYSGFKFDEQYSQGWSETYEVPRAAFDKLLADQAVLAGVDIRYRHEITAIELQGDHPSVSCRAGNGANMTFHGRFILDASGFGRVLARLLQLESPSNFPSRTSVFTHIEDNIDDPGYDREKILITVHPEWADVWYWLIPFSDGRCSIGVVARPHYLEKYRDGDDDMLKTIVSEDPELAKLLTNAVWDTPVRKLSGYSANVQQLCTNQYALLGNAGEFLDPVFSSGVTIAMRSASLAAGLLDRQLAGVEVDWQEEYARPLGRGIDTFRAFVNAWYDGRFQDIIFHDNQASEIRKMICSILAGYAWDTQNPFVSSPERRLNSLWHYCKAQPSPTP